MKLHSDIAHLTSLLFVPGDRPEMVVKALQSGADGVIIDLEDSVAPDAKVLARESLAVSAYDVDMPVLVRVNEIGSEHFEADLLVALNAGVVGILIPKAASPNAIQHADRLATQAEAKQGSSSAVAFLLLIETARGLSGVFELCELNLERELRCAFGSGDYSFDIGAEASADEMEWMWPRSRIVVASRASGLAPPFDTVYVNFRDEEGFRASCERGRRLGFAGRMLIHPSQIDVTNDVYNRHGDLAWARDILSRFASEDAGGRGAIAHQEELLDYAHVRRAKAILRRSVGE